MSCVSSSNFGRKLDDLYALSVDAFLFLSASFSHLLTPFAPMFSIVLNDAYSTARVPLSRTSNRFSEKLVMLNLLIDFSPFVSWC